MEDGPKSLPKRPIDCFNDGGPKATFFEFPQSELYLNFNMAGYGLLNWQKEEIGNKMKELRLDAAIFTWKENAGLDASEFRVEGTPYFFRLKAIFDRAGDREETIVTYSPGQTTMESEFHLSPIAWYEIRHHLASWLNVFKKEVAAVDPWDELSKQKGLKELGPTVETENTPLSPDEVNLISEQLSELKDLFLAKSLVDEAHQANVESRLKYLEESVKNLKRVDFANIVYSTIIQLGVGKVLDSNTFPKAVEWMRNLFERILGENRLLPPPL